MFRRLHLDHDGSNGDIADCARVPE